METVSRLRYVFGLKEWEIQQRLAEDGQDVSRSTISRDLKRARARIEEEVGPQFSAKLVLGQALAKLDAISDDSLESGRTASAGGKAALYRVATAAIVEKVKLLIDMGLLTRAAVVVEVAASAIEKIPTGEQLADLFRTTQVDPDELVSEAERARRYGEPPTIG